MAGTYTPTDAITFARQMSHKIPSDVIQAFACDTVNSLIWNRFPWNWTLASLTAISCVDGQQDYALQSADATAFYRFKWLRLAQTNLTPVEYRELNQKNHIGVEVTLKGGISSIRAFSYEGAISKIRLEMAASVPSGTTLQIQGEYQTKPTKITSNAMSTALTIPDTYFNVFIEGVRWKLYELADDARAGVMKIDDEGHRAYTGQLGSFMNVLFEMQQAEDMSNGEDSAFPEYSFGVGKDQTPRIFG